MKKNIQLALFLSANLGSVSCTTAPSKIDSVSENSSGLEGQGTAFQLWCSDALQNIREFPSKLTADEERSVAIALKSNPNLKCGQVNGENIVVSVSAYDIQKYKQTPWMDLGKFPLLNQKLSMRTLQKILATKSGQDRQICEDSKVIGATGPLYIVPWRMRVCVGLSTGVLYEFSQGVSGLSALATKETTFGSLEDAEGALQLISGPEASNFCTCPKADSLREECHGKWCSPVLSEAKLKVQYVIEKWQLEKEAKIHPENIICLPDYVVPTGLYNNSGGCKMTNRTCPVGFKLAKKIPLPDDSKCIRKRFQIYE